MEGNEPTQDTSEPVVESNSPKPSPKNSPRSTSRSPSPASSPRRRRRSRSRERRPSLAPTRTLFVRGVPRDVPDSEVIDVFKQEQGYSDFRKVLSFCIKLIFFKIRANVIFVDYDTIENATKARDNLQGYKFKGAYRGIYIEFDRVGYFVKDFLIFARKVMLRMVTTNESTLKRTNLHQKDMIPKSDQASEELPILPIQETEGMKKNHQQMKITEDHLKEEDLIEDLHHQDDLLVVIDVPEVEM